MKLLNREPAEEMDKAGYGLSSNTDTWQALQAENKRLQVKIELAFDEDSKMAALLEQEQEIIKLTAERDELLNTLRDINTYYHKVDEVFRWSSEAIVKHELKK